MASSPSHRFGQIVGDLLEEILAPQLAAFCEKRGLYLDRKGERGGARQGKKVTWEDKFVNVHDLDFVIERGGPDEVRGRPLAFIEAAWRRYTKHSRNKAQEIQGAILPIAEKYEWDKPFLGAVLAGIFTDGSLTQMRSSGFKVLLFPYETIVAGFASVGIDVAFDETTPDAAFKRTVRVIERLSARHREVLKDALVASNRALLDGFFKQLQAALDKQIDRIVLIPLRGAQNEFSNIAEAIAFVNAYDESANTDGGFRKYELIIRYSNGDTIDASFAEKRDAVNFLKYVSGE